MTLPAERREVIEAVEVPTSTWGILTVMYIQVVSTVAQATSKSVALKRLLPQRFPIKTQQIFVVSHNRSTPDRSNVAEHINH